MTRTCVHFIVTVGGKDVTEGVVDARCKEKVTVRVLGDSWARGGMSIEGETQTVLLERESFRFLNDGWHSVVIESDDLHVRGPERGGQYVRVRANCER